MKSLITLCLESIGMDPLISEKCYKGIILKSNYRKMAMKALYNALFLVHTNGPCGPYQWT